MYYPVPGVQIVVSEGTMDHKENARIAQYFPLVPRLVSFSTEVWNTASGVEVNLFSQPKLSNAF